MKILVLSDSHGTMQYMCDAVEKEHPDYVIHLGDHARDASELSSFYPRLPIASVCGNCDRGADEPVTQVAVYDGVKIFFCHGHTYGVKSGVLRAVYAAREQGADILLFGHTHIPVCDASGECGVLLLNPGACSQRNYYGKPSYGIIELGQGSPVLKYYFL